MSRFPDFRQTLFEAFAADRRMTRGEATDLAARVTNDFLTSKEVGGPHAGITDFELQWRALCREAAEQARFLPGGGFEARGVLGALRWIFALRYQLVSPVFDRTADPHLQVDDVEAAVCLALGEIDGEPADRSVDDRRVATHERVQAIVGRGLDWQELRVAKGRLQALHCLTPRDGDYGLREILQFQVVDD